MPTGEFRDSSLPLHLPPIHRQPSFVRHLDVHEIPWRWYSFEAGTLRLADAHYRLSHHHRFAFFSKSNLNWKTRLEIRIDVKAPSFLEDAALGTLPSVAWIDPNFSNFNPIGFQTNDDHAPADIRDGQELVLAVYHALATSPQWERTLLIVFYDEHGGSSTMSRRPKRQMTIPRSSDATECGCRLWLSPHGSNQGPSRTPSSTTRR